jgi:hypothetical protein
MNAGAEKKCTHCISQSIKNSQPIFFSEFPEGLQRSDLEQCTKFNEQLMRRIVMNKKAKNAAFYESVMMDEMFIYPGGGM